MKFTNHQTVSIFFAEFSHLYSFRSQLFGTNLLRQCQLKTLQLIFCSLPDDHIKPIPLLNTEVGTDMPSQNSKLF